MDQESSIHQRRPQGSSPPNPTLASAALHSAATPTPPAPSISLAAYLLPHQFLALIFPITLLFGSAFGSLTAKASYFSNKRNVLNVLFVKNAWGWTSLVFVVYLIAVFGKSFLQAEQELQREEEGQRQQEEEGQRQQEEEASLPEVKQSPRLQQATGATEVDQDEVDYDIVEPPSENQSAADSEKSLGSVPVPLASSPVLLSLSGKRQTPQQTTLGTDQSAQRPLAAIEARVAAGMMVRAMVRWAFATLYWWIISQWFFGPGLFDRVFVYTGGSCSVDGHFSQYHCRRQGGLWSGGVDISGHMFLLTHACLFLMEELSLFLNVPEAWSALRDRAAAKLSVGAVAGLMGLWWWMLLMTSVYYHHLAEKLSGLFFGVLFWFATYVTTYKWTTFPAMPDQIVPL